MENLKKIIMASTGFWKRFPESVNKKKGVGSAEWSWVAGNVTFVYVARTRQQVMLFEEGCCL